MKPRSLLRLTPSLIRLLSLLLELAQVLELVAGLEQVLELEAEQEQAQELEQAPETMDLEVALRLKPPLTPPTPPLRRSSNR